MTIPAIACGLCATGHRAVTTHIHADHQTTEARIDDKMYRDRVTAQLLVGVPKNVGFGSKLGLVP